MRNLHIVFCVISLSCGTFAQDPSISLGQRALNKFTDVVLERAFNAMLDELSGANKPRPPGPYLDQISDAFVASLALSYAGSHMQATFLIHIEDEAGISRMLNRGKELSPEFETLQNIASPQALEPQFQVLYDGAYLLRNRLETLRSSVNSSAEWNKHLYKYQLYFHILQRTISSRREFLRMQQRFSKSLSQDDNPNKAFDAYNENKELLDKAAEEISATK